MISVTNCFCMLYLVRHGETEWNEKKIIQGHADAPLTSVGIKQIEDVANEFKDVAFDVIFSSDLLRAKRSAEIIRLERDLAIQTSELLRERTYGHFEGKTHRGCPECGGVIHKIDKNHVKFIIILG